MTNDAKCQSVAAATGTMDQATQAIPALSFNFAGVSPVSDGDSCLMEDCVFRVLMTESSIGNGGGDVLGSM